MLIVAWVTFGFACSPRMELNTKYFSCQYFMYHYIQFRLQSHNHYLDKNYLKFVLETCLEIEQ